jgi:hypothetical protein
MVEELVAPHVAAELQYERTFQRFRFAKIRRVFTDFTDEIVDALLASRPQRAGVKQRLLFTHRIMNSGIEEDGTCSFLVDVSYCWLPLNFEFMVVDEMVNPPMKR